MSRIRTPRFAHARLLVAILSCFAVGNAAAQSENLDELADLPFEQLLKTEVITAEKLARQISDAPSAVSIVTAQDIREFGYRSLGEILDSMRGLSMSNNASRGYLSGRGYANGGSNSGRLTLLIDGYRATDGFFGRTYFGTDGLLDVDLIERVEYIPGNGSSSYGDSAFLGVVNIVTKKGKDIDGMQVATGLGSHGWQEERVTYGKQLDSGLDLVLSMSMMDSNGRQLEGSSVYEGLERAEQFSNQRLFLKAGYEGWLFEAAQVKRKAGVPWDVSFREPDVNSFARLKYNGELSDHLKTAVDFYYGKYRAEEYFPWVPSADTFEAAWRGIDAKLVGTWFDRHTLVFGTEYRDDFRQRAHHYQDNIEVLEKSFEQSRQTWSLYAYDDYALIDNLQLNFGGRWDARNNGSETFSPRGAIVYSPVDGTTLKLSTGMANRQQTAYSESWAPNPLVEKVRTQELVWEQMLGPKTRLTTSLYRYRIDNFLYNLSVGWGDDNNHGPLASKGAEFELEHLWGNGVRLRASYAFQNSYFPERSPGGRHQDNMANNNAKLNVSAPLVGEYLRAGLSARYLGHRLQSWFPTTEPSYLVGDLTFSGKTHNWNYGFSIRNIGNTRYNHISTAWTVAEDETYPADRRNYWLYMGYTFR